MRTASERRELLKEVWEDARVCVACQLSQTRTKVVFGAGNADANLMFVGEAPGANEDQQGLPFVGAAGKLLDKLLAEIGMERNDVFIANTLKCLRYRALVQLGDGSWERVGRLVRSRYDGTVMSVGPDGGLEPKRVIGWHASPLGGRRVFKLTYTRAKRAGASKVSIELTGDHPVLTERGYVRVDELTADDRIATGQGLTDVIRDVVCGSLLGDASISAKSATVTMGHSTKQLGYAYFKAFMLADLDAYADTRRVAAVAGGEPIYDVVHVRTRADRAIGTLRSEFYRQKKVVPEWIVDELNARMLAVWFMDDGHTRVRGGGRRPLAEIATVGFDDADLQILIRGLARLGLPAKAMRGRLYFNADTTERLSELMAPYVPPQMRYKLTPEVAERIPYDVDRWKPGPRTVDYDTVEVEDVTDKPRADTTFFCIDVEDNHNFVTAGGVVHNCRPPNNRDPHPHELEACESYLFRQLELIEPTVVCTLGNFSTKLLRGDPTGISKLHGQAEVRTIGPRTVRLYPLYHPAAALYTPKTLELLRADFQRIPEVLALGPPSQPEPIAETPEFDDPAELEQLAQDRDTAALGALELAPDGSQPANDTPRADNTAPADHGGQVDAPDDDSGSEQLGLF